MSYRVTPQAWTPDDYKDVYSFTVKYEWMANICVWFLIKRGYPQVNVFDLRFNVSGVNHD